MLTNVGYCEAGRCVDHQIGRSVSSIFDINPWLRPASDASAFLLLRLTAVPVPKPPTCSAADGKRFSISFTVLIDPALPGLPGRSQPQASHPRAPHHNPPPPINSCDCISTGIALTSVEWRRVDPHPRQSFINLMECRNWRWCSRNWYLPPISRCMTNINHQSIIHVNYLAK